MHTTETLEDTLETARENKTPVSIALGGLIHAPVSALVLGRNGQTFEFAIGDLTIRIDVSQVILLSSPLTQ